MRDFLCLIFLFAGGMSSSVLAADPFEKLEPFFQPPKEWAGDLGTFKSPLTFYDGTRVKTPADWPHRRQEILDKWHGLMGPWPELLKNPQVEVLKEERRDNLTQRHLRIEVAPGKFTEDAYLLLPDGEGPFPAVVVVYYDALTGVGLGKTAGRDFALELAKRGFVALSLGSATGDLLSRQRTLPIAAAVVSCV